MIFSRRLAAGPLVGLCHLLRHSIDAGVPVTKVFRQQAERGPAAVRPLAGRGPAVFGLGGVGGAVLFVALNFGGAAAVVLLYLAAVRVLGEAAAPQRLLLRLPGVGPCLRALALGRFALALSLTTGAGLAV